MLNEKNKKVTVNLSISKSSFTRCKSNPASKVRNASSSWFNQNTTARK